MLSPISSDSVNVLVDADSKVGGAAGWRIVAKSAHSLDCRAAFALRCQGGRLVDGQFHGSTDKLRKRDAIRPGLFQCALFQALR
jgi:hypothetical protein